MVNRWMIGEVLRDQEYVNQCVLEEILWIPAKFLSFYLWGTIFMN
jgi:hypothetical protein